MAIQDDANNSKNLKDNLKEADKVIKGINDSSTKLRSDFGAINDIFKDLSKNSVFYSDDLQAAVDSSKNLEKSAAILAKFDKEHLKDEKELNKIANEEKKVLKEITDLESQRRVLSARKLALDGKKDKASLAELRRINKALEVAGDTLEKAKETAGFFEDIRKTNDELNKKTAFFDKLDNFFGKIPIIGPAFGEFAKASKEIRDNLGSGQLLSSLDALMSLTFKSVLATTAAGIVTGLKRQDEQVTSLARNLNLARGRAVEFRDNMVRAANDAGKPVSFLLEGMEGVNAELGTQGMISLDAAKQFSTLTHRLGLSADEATRLFNASAAIGTSFKDLNQDVAGNVQFLNDVNNTAIDYKQVMKDIGSFSSATLLTQSKFEGSLSKAAFTARKLGLEMGGLESIAGNLLNFEESIASELEAELLTGRQLNLDNARLAALKGDMTTLAEELNAQNIDATTFGEMNVLQQEAVAKAMGMGREEMAKMLSTQEAINRVADELNMQGFGDMDLEAQVAAMEKAGKTREQALRELGKEELANQELNRTSATALKEISLALKENIEGDTLNELTKGPLDAMKDNMDTMRNAMLALSAAGILYYAMGGLSNLGNIGRSISGMNIGGRMKGLRTAGIRGFKNPAAAQRLAGFKSKGINPLSGGAMAKGTSSTMKAGTQLSLFGAAATGGTSTASTAGKTVASNITKGTSKTVAKSVGKSMLKKIPIVGTLAGIGFGISRAMQGDFTGAALEVASGLAANIPVAGTAISAGIDLGLAGRDIYKGQSRGNIDSTVKEAAQLANNQVNLEQEKLKLMKERNGLLKKIVDKDPNTYINGSKVSDQLALASTNIT